MKPRTSKEWQGSIADCTSCCISLTSGKRDIKSIKTHKLITAWEGWEN